MANADRHRLAQALLVSTLVTDFRLYRVDHELDQLIEQLRIRAVVVRVSAEKRGSNAIENGAHTNPAAFANGSHDASRCQSYSVPCATLLATSTPSNFAITASDMSIPAATP